MIKQNIILLFVLTLNLTTSVAQNDFNKYDENGKRHGIWKKNYPKTNQLRYWGKFNHGKEIDTFKYYKLKRKKSVLSAVKVYNNTNNNAEVTFMTSKGSIVSKGIMNGKKFIGHWVYFHKNSDVVMIDENYNNAGKLEGIRNVYFNNGVLAESINYSNGEKNGFAKIYSRFKALLQESSYKNDKLSGKTVYYDGEGKKKAEGNFKFNLKTGIWDYYTDGKLTKKVDHDNDKVIYKKQ